jgi:hypothetical protein
VEVGVRAAKLMGRENAWVWVLKSLESDKHKYRSRIEDGKKGGHWYLPSR